MSFGFSIGDFIAVGKLIVKIVDSLRSSKSEYQELIRELESLGRDLDHVDKLKERGNQAIAVDQIKCAALTCQYPPEDLLSKIKKHEKNLGLESSGMLKDAGRKIQWAFGKRDEGLEMLDVSAEQMEKYQGNLKKGIENSSKELREVRGDMKAQALAMQENSSMIKKLFWMVGGDVVAPIKVLMDMVAKVCVSTQQVYTIVLELRASIPGFDTRFTYSQAPVKVEDVLGRVFPFPSECSVSALEAEIKARFKEGPGRKEVNAGKYEIFNAKNTEHLLTATADSGLLPGMSVSMAVVLTKEFKDGDKCPIPHCVSRKFVEVSEGGKKCSGCDVWFNGASNGVIKKRIRNFYEGGQIVMLVDTITNGADGSEIIRQEDVSSAQRPENPQDDLSQPNDDGDTDVSAFKRIRYDMGVLKLSTIDLFVCISKNRQAISNSYKILPNLWRNLQKGSQKRNRKSKWADSEYIGQEELHKAVEEVLPDLRYIPEYSYYVIRRWSLRISSLCRDVVYKWE